MLHQSVLKVYNDELWLNLPNLRLFCTCTDLTLKNILSILITFIIELLIEPVKCINKFKSTLVC